ncbi:fibroblast growth factor 1 [Exaiptasia diaphana]|uniref:Fibroblast growth factor n=1 Tax=Exaiptasia diaphana TaxID=2652724 RepID=A0A913Y303_EXADI|nr:fibroblast growth factor 1 [Exaiptasia diaphana]KXJ23054.1 Fibroblast growth factor 1 [Exaiptasia diaphana]
MTKSFLFRLLALGIVLCCSVTARKSRKKDKKCQNGRTLHIGFDHIIKKSQDCDYRVQVTLETRLYSSNSGRHLQIHNSGRVDGLGRENSPFANVSIETISFSIVLIRGVKSNLYLCMDKNGTLKGLRKRRRQMPLRRCRFREHEYSGYYMYQSDLHRDWFLTVNKRGKVLKGPRGQFKLKAKLFLQRDFEEVSNDGNFYRQRKKLGKARTMKKIKRIMRKKTKRL